jgi:hypothetical protein
MKDTKGGRPSLKTSERRKYLIGVRLNTEEEYTLRALSKEASMSKQDYLRQCVTNSIVVQRINPEISDMVRKLCGMANNLNQIAKKANLAGYENIRSEYFYLAESIAEIINCIINNDSKNNDRK